MPRSVMNVKSSQRAGCCRRPPRTGRWRTGRDAGRGACPVPSGCSCVGRDPCSESGTGPSLAVPSRCPVLLALRSRPGQRQRAALGAQGERDNESGTPGFPGERDETPAEGPVPSCLFAPRPALGRRLLLVLIVGIEGELLGFDSLGLVSAVVRQPVLVLVGPDVHAFNALVL